MLVDVALDVLAHELIEIEGPRAVPLVVGDVPERLVAHRRAGAAVLPAFGLRPAKDHHRAADFAADLVDLLRVPDLVVRDLVASVAVVTDDFHRASGRPGCLAPNREDDAPDYRGGAANSANPSQG